MDVAACVQALRQCVEHLRRHNAAVRIVFTVSPIRYRKYGYHGSQLSKSTLLLAIDQLVAEDASDSLYYFLLLSAKTQNGKNILPEAL